MPVRTGTPFLPWHDPREATRLLRYGLSREGVTHTYQSDGVSVTSVPAELTVRCADGSFVANEEGGAPVTHFIDDLVGMARHFDARRRRQGPSSSFIDSVCGPTVQDSIPRRSPGAAASRERKRVLAGPPRPPGRAFL